MSVLGISAVIATAVLVGTVLQRISGSGVGLVVAPVLTIIIGPGLGVLITNMTTMVSGFLIMLAVLPRIDWRRYRRVGLPAVLGAVPGAWLVGQLSAGWLAIILAGLVLCALALTIGLPKLPQWTGRTSGIIAGTLGGFFNTTSGVAAPVMVVYSRVSAWGPSSFAATMQPIFLTMGAASVVTKLAMGSVDTDGHVPVDLWVLFPLVVVTVLVGIGAGGLLAKVVTPTGARRLAMTLATLGAVGALIRGVLEVAGG
ncbi:sulfite exporter TauE/SafE family protein [Nesterenkonia marinintestina]|uniref:sulfite exporter TauE/SafE family protein n=1 Tax=Nesterenkonia marinintestina TaxID=2979865 RepID=UPI0021C0426B|nr:sulfite exporter TauE/SafE family protein [Nesterenkonia sp. GX14115]